jgi:HlyD family secretion protein
MLQKADVAEVLAAEASRGRSRRYVRIGIVAAAVILAVAAGVWGWSIWRNATTVNYLTETVARGDITVTLVATGTLEPTLEVSVASLVSGTITSVGVDYNDTVTKGQLLAQIDPTDLEATQRNARAKLDAATANRDAAQATVDDSLAALRRTEELGKNDVVSSKELELAASTLARDKASLAASEAELRAAQADLDGADSDLAKATISSPIDGIVLDLSAEVGQTIGSSSDTTTSLFTIASDLARLDLEVDIDEADIPQVAVGDTASFTVEAAPDQTLLGTISQVRSGPTVSDGVTSYVALIAVDNASLLLKPGMTATADITTDEAKDVLTVSNTALRFVPTGVDTPPADQSHVYVLDNGQPRLVAVTTGISNGQRTVITSGELAAGDVIISAVEGS